MLAVLRRTDNKLSDNRRVFLISCAFQAFNDPMKVLVQSFKKDRYNFFIDASGWQFDNLYRYFYQFNMDPSGGKSGKSGSFF